MLQSFQHVQPSSIRSMMSRYGLLSRQSPLSAALGMPLQVPQARTLSGAVAMGNFIHWPELYRGESIRSFVMRFATENAITTPSRMVKLVAAQTGERLESLLDISCSVEALRKLSAFAESDGAVVTNMAYSPHESAQEPYVRCQGTIIPRDALLWKRAQLCPVCIREAPFLREEWDLAHVVACAKHGSMLLDVCPNCSAPIPANRLAVNHCP